MKCENLVCCVPMSGTMGSEKGMRSQRALHGIASTGLQGACRASMNASTARRITVMKAFFCVAERSSLLTAFEAVLELPGAGLTPGAEFLAGFFTLIVDFPFDAEAPGLAADAKGSVFAAEEGTLLDFAGAVGCSCTGGSWGCGGPLVEVAKSCRECDLSYVQVDRANPTRMLSGSNMTLCSLMEFAPITAPLPSVR